MQNKVLTAVAAVFLLVIFSSIATALGGGRESIANKETGATRAVPSTTENPVSTPMETTAPPTAKVATTPPKSTPKPAAVVKKPTVRVSQLGKVVKDGMFAFKVTAVKCGIAQVGDNILGDKAQGQYCRVTMTVQNIGDEAQTMFADNQYLYDTRGRKFSADGTAGMFDGSSKLMFEEINPGNSVTGNVFFDVPQGVKISRFELHDSMFSDGVRVNF